MSTPLFPSDPGSSTSILVVCRSMASRTGKFLLCFGGLLFCFYVQSWEAKQVKKEKPIPHAISLEVSDLSPDRSNTMALEGKAPPLARMRFSFQNRNLGESKTSGSGDFHTTIDLPTFIPWIRMQAFDDENRKLDDVNFKLHWDVKTHKPDLISARFFRKEKMIWITGNAPQDSFDLLAMSSDSVKLVHQEFPGSVNDVFAYTSETVRTSWNLRTTTTDYVSPANGMIDLVFPFSEDWAKKIIIRAGRDSAGIPIVEAQRDTLGLRRNIQLQLPRPADISRFRNLEKSSLVLNPGARAALTFKCMARLNYRITLPADHPYATALVRGLISQKTLIEMLIGNFNNALVAVEDFRSLKKSLGENGDSISAFAPGFTVSTGANPNWMNIQGSTSIFLDDNLKLDGQPQGIAGLFPPENDSLKILLNGQKFSWVETPFPKFANDSLAVWLGGCDMALPRFLVGLSPLLKTNGSVTANTGAKSRVEESQKDFFNRFESRMGHSEGNAIWTKILCLVPFLWAAWIIRRFPRRTRRVSAPLMVLTGLFAFLTVVDITSGIFAWLFTFIDKFRSTMDGNLGFQYGIRNAVSWFGNSGPATEKLDPWSYFHIFADSFWMVFSGMIIFSPLYFKELVVWAESSDGETTILRKKKRFSTSVKAFFRLAGWILFLASGVVLFLVHLRVSENLAPSFGSHHWVYRIFAQTPLVTAWAFQVPVVRYLIDELLPGSFLEKFRGWLGACLASAIPILSVYLPVQLLLGLTAAALFTGLGWTVFYGFDLPALDGWLGRKKGKAFWITVGVFAGSFAIGRPYLGGDVRELHLYDINIIIEHLQDVILFLTAMAFFAVIWKKSRSAPELFLDRESLRVGGFLFAAVMVGVSTTWVALPVPFLVACLLARFTLFETLGHLERLRPVQLAGVAAFRNRVRTSLEYIDTQNRFQSVQDALSQKLMKAELSPDDYKAKILAYQTHFAGESEAQAQEVVDVSTGTDPVFATGGPNPRLNVLGIFKKGALLSLIPLALGLYQYFPSHQASYPFPWVDFVIHIVRGSCYWMLLVLFFAFFYGALRGRTGLTKGLFYSLMIALPFAVYRVMETQSLQDMRPFLLWAAEMVLFFSFLGLWAGDLRLLLESGFKLKDLRRVHNLPFLSAYASTLVTAVAGSLVAFLSGQMTDFFKFFLQIFMKQGAG